LHPAKPQSPNNNPKQTKTTQEMNTNIEIIEDNSGGLTIQNTETKAVAYFRDKILAVDSIKDLLEGEDMSGWDTCDSECYITDEEYQDRAQNGSYKLWGEDDAKEYVA
jgi:hypothetical protein